MAAVPKSLLDATTEFLRRHPPFDEMAAADVEYFAAGAKLGYYAKASVITGPDAGVAATLHLVQRGLVSGRVPGPGGDASGDDVELAAGELFPLAAVLARRATTTQYVAEEDTFTYEFGGALVHALAARSPVFQRFYTHYIDSLLARATTRARELHAANAVGEQSMTRTIGSIIRRAPVTVQPNTPLGDALALMVKHKIGSVVVTDADRAPVGVFTERALVRFTAESSVQLDAPIERYMGRDVVTLPPSALLAEAAVALVQRGRRYVLVVEAGQLVGIVSERDLFALQRLTMGQVLNQVGTAESVDALASAAESIRRLAKNLLAQGIGAEQLTQLIATLNDKLTQRILDLECVRHGVDPHAICWIALGSEGRHEQTFSTDQDNAIIFRGEPAMRESLLGFARAVNQTLDACGFPLCKGNIMASNPALCLTLGQWQARFGEWISAPSPEALLNAAIFFDLRAVWGEAVLADELRRWLARAVRGERLFLRMMAENALQTRAPLGFFGELVTSGERGTIDLKAQGTRIFIDAARVQALAAGVLATNTAARLRALGEANGVQADDLGATIDAFHFVLMLRLQHQEAGGEAASANRVDPRTLNDLDRRILKEALKRAAGLQDRLRLDYQL